MLLSVVIPARNEEGSILDSLERFSSVLRREGIPHELVITDDGSTDATSSLVRAFAVDHPEAVLVSNRGSHGFGMAVRAGLQRAKGDAVAIAMADCSDSPEDLIVYYRTLQQGYDCVFGSRFIRGGKLVDYPKHKLMLNRLANWFIGMIFGFRYNDTTNAFKCYRQHVIAGLQPLISPHFNLTVEMPLKAMVRGYSYAVVPITWTNRKTGFSKLKIKEMGSRYLFIIFYVWLEKWFARGDYHRSTQVKANEALSQEMKEAG